MPNHRNVYIFVATSMSKTGKFQLTPLVNTCESLKMICSALGGNAVPYSACKKLFEMFRIGNFDLETKRPVGSAKEG